MKFYNPIAVPRKQARMYREQELYIRVNLTVRFRLHRCIKAFPETIEIRNILNNALLYSEPWLKE